MSSDAKKKELAERKAKLEEQKRMLDLKKQTSSTSLISEPTTAQSPSPTPTSPSLSIQSPQQQQQQSQQPPQFSLDANNSQNNGGESLEVRVQILEQKLANLEKSIPDLINAAVSKALSSIGSLPQNNQNNQQQTSTTDSNTTTTSSSSSSSSSSGVQSYVVSKVFRDVSPWEHSANEVDTKSDSSWTDGLAQDEKAIVDSFQLTSKASWFFPNDKTFSPAELDSFSKLLSSAKKAGKSVNAIQLNASPAEWKPRQAKELAAALHDQSPIDRLNIFNLKKNTGWTLLKTLTEVNAKINCVCIDAVDLVENWSSSQCSTTLKDATWQEFIVQNGTHAEGSLKREDWNYIYESIGTALTSNIHVKRLTLRNLPSCSTGDISRLLDKLVRNQALEYLNLSLGSGVWDRLRVKSLAALLSSVAPIKTLVICGAERSIFEISEFVKTLSSSKKTKLETLVLNPIGTNGMLFDAELTTILKTIVSENPKLTIYGSTDGTDPQPVSILSK